MKKIIVWFLFVSLSGIIMAQSAKEEDMVKGISFIETKMYSQQENTEMLKLYDGLRVADVSDGMDFVGLSKVGLVDQSIHPDWTDIDGLTHIFRG